MLKIRLQRQGRKGMPVFRIVVAEHTMPVQGRFVEKLGGYTAGRKEETLVLNKDRVIYWLSVGAKPSDVMARFLTKQGIKEAEKFIKQRKQVPSKAEVKAAEEKKAAEEAKKAEAEEKAAAKAAEDEAKKAEAEAAKAEETKEEAA